MWFMINVNSVWLTFLNTHSLGVLTVNFYYQSLFQLSYYENMSNHGFSRPYDHVQRNGALLRYSDVFSGYRILWLISSKRLTSKPKWTSSWLFKLNKLLYNETPSWVIVFLMKISSSVIQIVYIQGKNCSPKTKYLSFYRVAIEFPNKRGYIFGTHSNPE